MQRLMTLSCQGMTRFGSDCRITASRVIRGSVLALRSRTPGWPFPRPSLDRATRTQGPAWTLARVVTWPLRVPTDPLVAAPGRSGGYGAGPPTPQLRRAGGRPYRSQPGMRAFAGSCRHWRGHHPRSEHEKRNLRNISTKAKKGPNSHVKPCTST